MSAWLAATASTSASAWSKKAIAPTGAPRIACCSTAPSKPPCLKTAAFPFSPKASPTTVARSAWSPISIRPTACPSTTSTTQQMATKVKRTQVDVVLPDGVAVLNADDPLVADMAGLCDGEVMFFASDAGSPVIAEHLKQGKRGVFVRNGDVILAHGDKEMRVSTVAAIPITGGGAVSFQIENVLAAVAAAWALGISADLIRAGIELFGTEQAEEQDKKRKAQAV